MKNTFLDSVFSQFSLTDFRQLQKFVASPYFNGRPQLIPLLDHLVVCYQQNLSVEKEKAFSASFPDQPFDDQLWRLTISQLFKLTEQWLAIRQVEQEPTFPKLALSRAYRHFNLEGHYQRNMKGLQQALDKETQRAAEFYENQYQLEWEKYRFVSSGKRTEAFNLQAVSDAMDTAFIARKLRHACFAISHEAVFKTNYELGLLHAVLEQVAANPNLSELPAIGLYYYCYLALTQNDEGHFQTFIEALSKNAAVLPLEEQRNLYLLAINFGIRQINASRPAYDRPVLDLYKSALENGLLHENNRLSHFAFNNMVAIAVRIGENDWVEEFMKSQKNNLERKHRQVAYSLGMARLEYARKNFGQALLYLQNADYKDFINNIIAKTLQMKIYFETGERDALDAHLRNMKTYIRRQRAFGYHRENYLNIIRFTQALIELNPFEREGKMRLRQEILEAGRLTEREWLLEQLGSE
ncbi:MAG: hypothetical protein R2788_14970 [Saprospiraceae bacterium]